MNGALGILGLKEKEDANSIYFLIEKGLPKSAFLKAKKTTGLSNQVLAEILSVSAKTIEKKKASDRFDDTASERLYRLAEVIALGQEALGDGETFKEWLHRPLPPLDGHKPLEMMKNTIGLELVKEILGRIKHGVYS
ncbi:MAG: antitoxin Xre/MbcA/ParS toxin-binding domain-containing protein [Cyclobacteriaceae bacterium]